jgi:prepilin-type N-terminal cleavage/methylation domain-containing protein
MTANTRQKGFTALELIVVLIVGLGIIALAASKMDLLFGNANISEEISNINTLLSNTKNLKTVSGYGATGTDLIPELISTSGIPKNMTLADGLPYNVWGGAVAVTSSGTGFAIVYQRVPQDACIKLATKTNKGGTFATVQVNDAHAITGEYTAAQANTDCRAGAENRLSWAVNS